MHRISENKGWEHDTMMKMRKRILFRYFNYIMQDNKDRKEEIDNDKEERERKELLAQRKKEREDWLMAEGKLK